MTQNISCPSRTPQLTPTNAYYLHKVVNVTLTSDTQVSITAESPQGTRVTFCVDWLIANAAFGDVGDAFDAGRIWVGGPTTLRRSAGTPSPGVDKLLISKGFIEDTPFERVAEWLAGIKYPQAAGF